GDVTIGVIYCRLPELGGFWSTLLGKTRHWSQFEVMSRARRLLAEYPDVRGSVQFISLVGQAGRNSELQFNITGPDLEKLLGYSTQIIDKLRPHQGIADLDITLSNRKPELQVNIDRDKASQFGLRVTDIANTLHTLVGGEIAGTYKEEDEQYDVWLRAEAKDRNTQEALSEVMLRAGGARANTSATNGPLVQLSNFVKLQEARGPK